MQDKFDDTQLMAYADGELDAGTRTEIEQAAAQDPVLAGRLEVFTKTRQTAAAAFEPLLDAPVPDALAGSIADMVARHEVAASAETYGEAGKTDNVVAFRPSNWFSAPRFELALAASLALVAGGVIGYLASGLGGPTSSDGILTADLSHPGIPAALRSVASGDETALDDGTRFRAIASFRDEAGGFCREFEVDRADLSTVVSVACQTDAQWRVQFTVVSASADAGYAPASSLEALDAYLSAIGAGEPLSAADEQTALNALR